MILENEACYDRCYVSTKAHATHRATTVHSGSTHVPARLPSNLDATHGVSTSSVRVLIDIAQRLTEWGSRVIISHWCVAWAEVRSTDTIGGMRLLTMSGGRHLDM